MRRPFEFANDLFGVRVQQQFIVVEAVTGVGRIRPMHAIAIQLAGTCVGQIAVPDLVGIFGERDALLLAATVVEQT